MTLFDYWPSSSRPDTYLFHAKRAILAALCLIPFTALAQDTAGDGSTVVYPAEYFSEWQPITAQDMLARIPGQDASGPGRGGPPGGFTGNPTRGGRGLGAGSSGTEIMINGKRTAGKNQSASSLLGRIAASQVQEIQIIRGTSGELDVRGSSQVINVILFEELASSSISYEAAVNYAQDDTINPGGTVALNGQRGDFDYLLTLRSQPRYSNDLNNESSILGDFSPNDTVIEERTRDGENNELSFNLGYAFTDNSRLQVNGLYAQREALPNERDNWEFGGDYEYTFGNGARFKLLGIANRDDNASQRQRFQRFADNSEELNLFLDTKAITEERIVRGSYTFDLFLPERGAGHGTGPDHPGFQAATGLPVWHRCTQSRGGRTAQRHGVQRQLHGGRNSLRAFRHSQLAYQRQVDPGVFPALRDFGNYPEWRCQQPA